MVLRNSSRDVVRVPWTAVAIPDLYPKDAWVASTLIFFLLDIYSKDSTTLLPGISGGRSAYMSFHVIFALHEHFLPEFNQENT